MTTMREAVDATIEAYGSAGRPGDAGLVQLAREYADAIDGRSEAFDIEGLDPLARYGPKLTAVLERLRVAWSATRGEPGPRTSGVMPPGFLDGKPPAAASADAEVVELAALRERRAGR